ncbi:MAG: hypothetical protein AB1351_11995 [Thermoproteota archaeon]
MSGNRDYGKSVPGKRLREALSQASAVLGRATQDAMFHDLELAGMNFKDRQYTLNELQDALRRIFGQDGTSLLMQRVEKALEE